MKPGNETAAICGLFCGTCPHYPAECNGCLSDTVAADCQSCASGFRDCAREHGVVRCHECAAFPCALLKNFSTRHIVNGICHHAQVIDDLQRMREIGVDAWVAQQTQAHTCARCGRLIPWYESACPACKGRDK